MKKKIVLLAFVLIVLSMSMFGTRLVTTASTSTTRDVYPSQSIQDAINSAKSGDTIFVHAGTYYEHVVVNKTVTLIGENKYNTIINGGKTENVVYITANNVSIQSFAIQRSGCACKDYSGIRVENSHNINITNNLITENGFGIKIHSSHEIIVARNDVIDNYQGINVGNSSGCVFYHNNFVNNEQSQAVATGEYTWDDGYPSGGNYWSDYKGTDFYSGSGQNEARSDGIGDEPYEIPSSPSNMDRFPLMAPITVFGAGTWNETTYYVHTVSNSTVSDFYFSKDNKLVSFNVTGPDGTVGFCRVTIPNEFLWCDSPEEWQVLVNNTLIEDRKIMGDTNYTYIYFTYNHTTQNVEITGVHVIPEFPLSTIPLIFMILSLITAVFIKLKKKKQ